MNRLITALLCAALLGLAAPGAAQVPIGSSCPDCLVELGFLQDTIFEEIRNAGGTLSVAIESDGTIGPAGIFGFQVTIDTLQFDVEGSTVDADVLVLRLPLESIEFLLALFSVFDVFPEDGVITLSEIEHVLLGQSEQRQLPGSPILGMLDPTQDRNNDGRLSELELIESRNEIIGVTLGCAPGAPTPPGTDLLLLLTTLALLSVRSYHWQKNTTPRENEIPRP